MAPPCPDRLSGLPDCLLHGVLSGLGSRQAVRTSLLSRRWRQLWRDVPCANIDEREFADDTWERFEDFADHMLTSIPPNTQLDAFRLHLLRGKDTYWSSFTFPDRWIRRGLRHFPMTIDIRAASHSFWLPYLPSISPNSLDTVSSAASYYRRLTTLHLVQVRIHDSFTMYLGESCLVAGARGAPHGEVQYNHK
ncbi:MEIOTIC F-BOX protein MOF-like [Lolium perenne]|uniref:MEIOTIC F-BOX protein MOF-like n=1 Tax=Lolium perenne TaxID=4522 RepID=UPI0021F67781|nr:MEIOTIC F-BOX protein MOF-like [Lolium perenne]